jgi:hypothetical protein
MHATVNVSDWGVSGFFIPVSADKSLRGAVSPKPAWTVWRESWKHTFGRTPRELAMEAGGVLLAPSAFCRRLRRSCYSLDPRRASLDWAFEPAVFLEAEMTDCSV